MNLNMSVNAPLGGSAKLVDATTPPTPAHMAPVHQLKREWNDFLGSSVRPTFQSITGEFVNVETFWLHMDALFIELVSHDYLDWTWGGQSLVLISMVERFLQSLWQKGAKFRLVFLEAMAGLYHAASPTLALMYEVLRRHIAASPQLSRLLLLLPTCVDESFRDAVEQHQPSFMLISLQVKQIMPILNESVASEIEICFASTYIQCRIAQIPVALLSGISQGLSSISAFYEPWPLKAGAIVDSLEQDRCGWWKRLIAAQSSSAHPVDGRAVPTGDASAVSDIDLWIAAIKQLRTGTTLSVGFYRKLAIALSAQRNVPRSLRCQKRERHCDQIPGMESKLSRNLQALLQDMASQLRRCRQTERCNVGAVDVASSCCDLIDGRFFGAVFNMSEQMELRNDGTCSLPGKIFDEFVRICGQIDIVPHPWCKDICAVGDSDDVNTQTAKTAIALYHCSVRHQLTEQAKRNVPAGLSNVIVTGSNRHDHRPPVLRFDERYWSSGKLVSDLVATHDSRAKQANQKAAQNPRFSEKGKQRLGATVKAYGDSLKHMLVAAVPNFAEPQADKKTETNLANIKQEKDRKGQQSAKKKQKSNSRKDEIIQLNAQRRANDEQKEVAVWCQKLDNSIMRADVDVLNAAHQVDCKMRKVVFSSTEVGLVMKSIALHKQVLEQAYRFDNEGTKKHAMIDVVLRIRYLFSRYSKSISAEQRGLMLEIWSDMGFSPKIFGYNHNCPSSHTLSNQGLRLNTEWLEYMFQCGGELMEIQNDPQKDSRTAFYPDAWQRELLDAVDCNQSTLVIAPTSAGKTFVSYYCIERVLEANRNVSKTTELGYVVYVSPTKALTNQVAATVYAKFCDYQSASGCPVFGVFTRDYCTNLNNCQVLITVPQCLDILLMSPGREKWINQLRWVILDEIHCIGGSYIEGDDVNVWEHIVKMFPCPFIALSATVGNPADLHKWFSDLEELKIKDGIRSSEIRPRYDEIKTTLEPPAAVRLVTYSERYSELHHYLFRPPKSAESVAANAPQNNSSLGGDASMTPLHPVAVCSGRNLLYYDFPKDQCLTSVEATELYEAMAAVDADVRDRFRLTAFFVGCAEKWLTRSDLRQYEAALKAQLTAWVRSKTSNARAKADRVLALLRQNCKEDLKGFSELTATERYACHHVSSMVLTMRSENMLPCLAFGENRGLCERLSEILVDDLRQREESFLDDPNRAAVIKDWQRKADWMSKQRKRLRDVKSESSHKNSNKGSSADGQLNQDRRGGEQASVFEEAPFPFDLAQFSLVRRGIGSELLEQRKEIMLRKDVHGEQLKLLLACLERGVGFHHSGMTKSQRETVEILFRAGFLSIVFTTSTLALGIHMPCRSVAFTCDSMHLTPLKYRQMAGRAGRRGFDKSGNVVFFSLPTRKITRLLTASLPLLRGNTPFTPASLLRLLTLCSQVKHPEKALARSKLFLGNHLVTYAWEPALKEQFRLQIEFYVIFCTDYLHSLSLVDAEGRPVGLAGMVNHLSYHQPGCFVLVYLMQKGMFHALCESSGQISAQERNETLVLVLSHLFTYLPIAPYADYGGAKNSRVYLGELPALFAEAVSEYNAIVYAKFGSFITTLVGYFNSSAASVSGNHWEPELGPSVGEGEILGCELGRRLAANRVQIGAQGFPIAMCADSSAATRLGQQYLVPPMDHRVFMDPVLLPSIPYPLLDHMGRPVSLNSYALDFYRHGIRQALVLDNGLREGEVFHRLKDFTVVLKSIVEVLKVVARSPSDPVLAVFEQLSEEYRLKFLEAFDMRMSY